MRVIIQRVNSSSVSVEGKIIGEIKKGLNLLVGIGQNDDITSVDWMVQKKFILAFVFYKILFLHFLSQIKKSALHYQQFSF